jgi:hypothetical protein
MSCADVIIAHPLLSNSRKQPGSMVPLQLKHPKSALLNKSSDCAHAPSALALLQPKTSGDQNTPQTKTSADQNVPLYQNVSFEVVKRFIKAIVFTMTPWQILSDDMYSMVGEAWKLHI